MTDNDESELREGKNEISCVYAAVFLHLDGVMEKLCIHGLSHD